MTFSKFSITFVFSLGVAACEAQSTALEFAETTICVPSQYTPEESYFEQLYGEDASGFDQAGQPTIVRLPAELIRSGVPSYSLSHRRYSEVTESYFQYEHTVSGIVWDSTSVGNPFAMEGNCSKSSELCYQTLVYKDFVFMYQIHKEELSLAREIKGFLEELFSQWERDCAKNG